ncbi:unnamed protein product [Phaeothamnion confervicola]
MPFSSPPALSLRTCFTQRRLLDGTPKHLEKGQGEGEGAPTAHSVSCASPFQTACRSVNARSPNFPANISTKLFRLSHPIPSNDLPLSCRGLDNAGKTTIVKKFNGEDICSISPTLGFDISTLEHRGYSLNVWDVGGQQTIRSYWRNYFEQTDGLVWVVDAADRARLDICRSELADLLKQEKLAGASLLVFANKQDLAGALPPDEIAKALGLRAEAFGTRHWSILGCSAVTGAGLVEGMDWMVGDISSRIFMMS